MSESLNGTLSAEDRVMRAASSAGQSVRGFDDASSGWWSAMSAPGVRVDIVYQPKFSPTLARGSFAAIEQLAGWMLTNLPTEPWEVDGLADDAERIEQMRAAAVELERLAHGLKLTLDGTREEGEQ